METAVELEVNSIPSPNRALVTCIIHQSREENQPQANLLYLPEAKRGECSSDCLPFLFFLSSNSYTSRRELHLSPSVTGLRNGSGVFY